MSSVNTPKDLFFDQLRDLYSMEGMLRSALPELAAFSTNEPLRRLIAAHAEEAAGQFEIVASIFIRHGVDAGDDECLAMAGLIEGGHDHLRRVEEPLTRDLMVIAHGLRVAHYEMAAYEISRRLARRLGLMGEEVILTSLWEEEKSMAESLLAMEPLIFEDAAGL